MLCRRCGRQKATCINLGLTPVCHCDDDMEDEMEGKFKTGKKGRPKDVEIIGSHHDKAKTAKIIGQHPMPEAGKVNIVSKDGNR